MKYFEQHEGTEEKEFIPRSYTKSELAHLYFPKLSRECATHKLNRWIKHCTCLYEELTKPEFSYQSAMRNFTAREVRLIVHYLGEP